MSFYLKRNILLTSRKNFLYKPAAMYVKANRIDLRIMRLPGCSIHLYRIVHSFCILLPDFFQERCPILFILLIATGRDYMPCQQLINRISRLIKTCQCFSSFCNLFYREFHRFHPLLRSFCLMQTL